MLLNIHTSYINITLLLTHVLVITGGENRGILVAITRVGLGGSSLNIILFWDRGNIHGELHTSGVMSLGNDPACPYKTAR
jgi:hypothetical protein